MADEENDVEENDADLERSDDELDAEAEDAEGGGKGGLKKLLIIIIPFLLIGIGGGLYFSGALDSMMGKKPAEEHAEEDGGHAEDKGDAHDDGHGDEKGDGHSKKDGKGDSFVEMPDLLVNLASSTGQPHFLRLRVKLELYSGDDLATVEGILPRVIDRFQTFLREMRVEDLRGSAGIYRLRQELLFRVNKAAAPVEVKDVLFQEILIQ